MGEEELLAWFIEQYNVDTGKLPETYSMDFWIGSGGQMLGYTELKGRKTPSTAYGSVTLFDASKWYACIEHEKRTGKPAILVVGFNDRVVAGVQPAAYGPVSKNSYGMSTPGKNSGSHNKGWTRPVVRIPLGNMTPLGTVPGEETEYSHPAKPRQSPFTSMGKKFGWVKDSTGVGAARNMDLANAVEVASGLSMQRMPHVHPLTHCLYSGKTLRGFVGLNGLMKVDSGFAVDVDVWFAALEHENIFAGTQSYLALPDGDSGNGVRLCRPSTLGSTLNTELMAVGDSFQRRMVIVPKEAFISPRKVNTSLV